MPWQRASHPLLLLAHAPHSFAVAHALRPRCPSPTFFLQPNQAGPRNLNQGPIHWQPSVLRLTTDHLPPFQSNWACERAQRERAQGSSQESRESQSKIPTIALLDFRPSRPENFDHRSSIHRNPILPRSTESAAERTPSARCNALNRCCAVPQERHFLSKASRLRQTEWEMFRFGKLNSLLNGRFAITLFWFLPKCAVFHD